MVTDRMTPMIVFARVVEAESFSGAGRRLGLSTSSVSRHVAELEGRLGAQLLHRTTRRLSLTEVGRVFYERCVRIVREVDEAEHEVGRLQTSPQGLLKVNAPMSFGHLQLAPAIADFAASHSQVRFEVALDDRAVDPIEGGFDVTIRVAPPLADSSLIARRLAPNRLVVCGSPGYLARRGVPRTPADIARHECLRYSYLSWGDAWHFVGSERDEWVTISGGLSANSGDALRAAALGGLGLLYVPSFIVAADLARGALRPVLEGYEDRSTSIWALYSPTRYRSTKVRAFVDFLAARFGPEPAWDAACRRRGPSRGKRAGRSSAASMDRATSRA